MYSTTNVNGFKIESCNESLAKWIFKTYPETTVNVQSHNPKLRKYYMNLLFDIIQTLGHTRCLSDAELSRSSNNLAYLTQAGFKVEWLRSKLETAYLEKWERDTCEARVVELKEEVKKLERTMSCLKAKLRNEKDMLNPCSFRTFLRSFFCLKA